MSKINVFHIVVDHFNTLRRFDDGKRSINDALIFFGLPFLISVGLIYFGVSIFKIVGDLLKAIAIFSAFLFNMLAIVNSSLNKESITNDKLRLKYAKEIHANLSFEILVGIILVLMLICQSLIPYDDLVVNYFYRTIEFINIFFLGVFFTTLLMCLNRVYILLRT